MKYIPQVEVALCRVWHNTSGAKRFAGAYHVGAL